MKRVTIPALPVDVGLLELAFFNELASPNNTIYAFFY